MKLIEDWRKAYKFASVQLAVVLGVVAGAAELVPLVKDHLPPAYGAWFSGAIILARLLKQSSSEDN